MYIAGRTVARHIQSQSINIHTMERSLFYICCGRQSSQEGKFQCEDLGHHDPEKQFFLDQPKNYPILTV